MENPDLSQQQIAEKAFKDNASITRIIELLVKSKYLDRKVNPKDRRTSILKVTPEGVDIINKVQGLVLENRKNSPSRNHLRGIGKPQCNLEKNH